MACKSAAARDMEIVSVSGTTDRRSYENTGSGIGYSTASSSPDLADVPAGEDYHDQRNPLRLIQTLTPPANTIYTSDDRRYPVRGHSWTYPADQSTSGTYYTAAGYPATETGSRTVTWSPPEIASSDDVKPTSFALSSPATECDVIYCTER